MKVLIIDDDQSICDYLSDIIINENHECYVVHNSHDAMEILKNTAIDITFIDIYLPGKDGFDICKQIRSLYVDNWIPIVFISASDTDENYEKCVSVGGDDYLVKPIRPIVVKTKLLTLERLASMKKKVDVINEKLKRLTHQDPLTKVHNRRYLQHHLMREWRSSVRDNEPLSLIMIDIDHFKKYNDFYGHIKGDVCLQKVAKCIESAVQRPRDIVARFGGEEFLVVLPDTNITGALITAKKIKQAITERKVPHPKSEVLSHLTVSLGVSSTEFEAETVEQLCEQADQALYQAKKEGRNRVMVMDKETDYSLINP